MWELSQFPELFLPAGTAPLFLTHNCLIMQNLSNGHQKHGKKKKNSWDLSHVQKQNVGVDRRGDRKVGGGVRGASLWKRVWGIFLSEKKMGGAVPTPGRGKEPQVLTKKNKRTKSMLSFSVGPDYIPA